MQGVSVAIAFNGSGIAEANGFERQKYQYGTELK